MADMEELTGRNQEKCPPPLIQDGLIELNHPGQTTKPASTVPDHSGREKSIGRESSVNKN
jgi:hypothetical protein